MSHPDYVLINTGAVLNTGVPALGYAAPVPFQSGLIVNSDRFTVTHNNVVYAAKSSELTFTTTATFDSNQWRLVNFGDNAGALTRLSAVEDELSNVEVINTSYSNGGGSGDRSDSILVQASDGLFTTGDPVNLIDGSEAAGTSTAVAFTGGVSVAGKTIAFDFGLYANKFISALLWEQTTAEPHGVWKVQGSKDLVNWTDIAADFTLGVSTSQEIELLVGFVSYRAVRLVGVSGTVSGSPFITEVKFKTASETGDQVITNDVYKSLPESLKPLLLRGYAFHQVTGAIVSEITGRPDSIDLDAANLQSYTFAAKGVRIREGVIKLGEIPGCIGYTLGYTAPIGGLGDGFLVEGPPGAGFLNQNEDSSASEELIACNGMSFRNTYAQKEYGTDRGTFALYHRERAIADKGPYAIGGRSNDDDSRASDMTVSFFFAWNAALSSDQKAALEVWSRQFMLNLGVTTHYLDAREQRDVYFAIGSSMAKGVDLAANLPLEDRLLNGSAALICASSGGEDNDVRLAAYNLFGSGHDENDTLGVAGAKVSPAFGVVYARTAIERDAGGCIIVNAGEGSSYSTPSSQNNSESNASWHPDEPRGGNANYHTAMRLLQMVIGQAVERGIAPTSPIYVFGAFGLNEAVSLDGAPSAAASQGWIEDINTALIRDCSPFAVKFMIMRAHEDDPISDPTALANVRQGIVDAIAANSGGNGNDNMSLLDNDGGTYIDGVHNPAVEMKAQGIAWHDMRNQ